GVVDEDIPLPEVLDGCVDESGVVGALADVRGHGNGLAAARGNAGDNSVGEVGCVEVVDDDADAVAGEGERNCLADAGCGTSDDRDLARQTVTHRSYQ